jgi:hypothetical protein
MGNGLSATEVHDPAGLIATTSRLLTVDDELQPRLARLGGFINEFIAAAGTDKASEAAATGVRTMYVEFQKIMRSLSEPIDGIVQAVSETSIGVIEADKRNGATMDAIDIGDLDSFKIAPPGTAAPTHGGGGRH